MKRFVFVFIVFLLPVISCNRQQDKEPEASIEEMPVPEGGIDAFQTWIDDNNRLKNISDTISENDKVYVQFTVDTTGLLTDIVIVRGFAPKYDKEAHRLVSSCPIKWLPARHEGRKVADQVTIPILFTQ